MNVLDLFSGIGGMALGFQRAGFCPVAFCEQAPFARGVLARAWPDVPCYGDVRTLSAAILRADGVPRADVLCGGFPCQDISASGRGAGLDGGRSVLWREMLRLVRECRPDWVVVENVPALRVRGADRVLDGLEAAGYACWPLVVGAAHAAAPHRRARVFVVARCASTTLACHASTTLARCASTRSACQAGTVLAHTSCARLEVRLGGPADPAARLPVERRRGWPAEPAVGRVADGVPARVDRVRALGNAVVPDVAEMIARALLAAQAAAERARPANALRNLATFGPTTARQ